MVLSFGGPTTTATAKIVFLGSVNSGGDAGGFAGPASSEDGLQRGSNGGGCLQMMGLREFSLSRPIRLGRRRWNCGLQVLQVVECFGFSGWVLFHVPFPSLPLRCLSDHTKSDTIWDVL